MSWCGCVCDTAEDVGDAALDFAGDVIDTAVDAGGDAIDTVGEFFSDAGEWLGDAAEDVGEAVYDAGAEVVDWVSDTLDDVWNYVSGKIEDAWEWCKDAAESAWDWMVDTAKDAWEWVSETASQVWDKVVDVFEAIANFVKEDLVPFLLDALWVLGHLDDIIIAGALGLWCLITGEDEREYDVLEGMFNLDPALLSTRSVRFLPQSKNYVVTSDLHMFVEGDTLDKFKTLGNHDLYKAVLTEYAKNGYSLIEAGDVEDLWMRETTFSGSMTDIVFDSLGWPFGDMLEDDYEENRIRSQAVKIFENNSEVYETIRNLFHNGGNYYRLFGNHDDSWREQKFIAGLRLVYPDIVPLDYAFIGPYGTNPDDHGGMHPKVIVAHGHQFDAWNNAACHDAGTQITGTVSGIPSLAAGYTSRAAWEAQLKGLGFDNELGEDVTSIDELEFYETTEKDFSNKPFTPDFIFGHTHGPRKNAQIPGWMSRKEWNFKEYTNTGTAGRWEQFIWCATIVDGNVELHGWTWDNGRNLASWRFDGGYADYLRPA